MASSFIKWGAFGKDVPKADPAENIAWLGARSKVSKAPYSKAVTDSLASMSYKTYSDLWYRDPLFRNRIWEGLLFNKTDYPILSTTPNIWQALYGQIAHQQVHREMTLLSALSMSPWVHDGARLLMADPTLQGEWVGEEDALPDTTKPDFDAYKCDSKWALTTWDVFEKAKQHAMRNEGIDLVTELLQTFFDIHKHFINVALLANAQTEAAAAGAHRYATAPGAVESIDRIISSDEEEDEHGSASYNHWYDPYDEEAIDRDSGTDYDSVVLMDTEEDRPITDALMKELIRKCEDLGMRCPAEGGKGFIFTGRDTRDDLAALHQAAKRWTPDLTSAQRRGVMQVGLGSTGIRTGYAGGFKVASYNDYPIIVDKLCPKDTKSRIYLIDGATLHLKMLMPFMHLSTSPADWLQINYLKDRHAWITVLELECLNFRCQGKIRDLC